MARSSDATGPLSPWWQDDARRVRLFHGDSLALLEALPPESVDLAFADPPYFLSNGGTTCRSGQRSSVDKGRWDRSQGVDLDHEFNQRWLAGIQRALKPNGTVWVSGTSHVIFSVGFAMQQLGFKLLNQIAWEKPNPPPNLSCRYFTHSVETILWAARDRRSRHHFDYREMKARNGDKQMKDVWRMSAPPACEKVHGRHPTQKPLALLDRILSAACPMGGVVLDPFNGSGTSGVAAAMRGHAYIGIDLDETYLDLTKRRIEASAPVGAAVGAAARRETAPGRAEAAPAASKLRVVPAAAGL